MIIPHLNEPEDLRRCLAALDEQRIDGIPFEIIVVDNGSRELPAALCASFKGVRLERELTPGPGPARNRGVEVARGELLAFIDADCFAQPGWVASIVGYMASHPHISFLGGDIRIAPADPAALTAIEAYESVYSYRMQSYVEREGFAASGNMAVRRHVFRLVGGFGGISSMEDTEWGKRATRMGYRIAYLPQARVVTPSCRSFAELARRWDRHVAHEYRNLDDKPVSRMRWLLRSAVMAASPVGEVLRVLRSDRVRGLRQRWLAFTVVARVRLYRARRMIELLLRDNTTGMLDMWNRESR